jgi:hypothetical protein
MQVLTKQLKKDWSQIQGHWGITSPTPKGRWHAFVGMAARIYKISRKEVINRIHNY